CSAWANLSFAVTNPAYYRYFPPFQAHVNANNNRHLGGESINMARSLVAGEGYSHPFDGPTGPTAWQPPFLPTLLAGLLCLRNGSRDAVMAIVVVLQVLVLIATGLLVMALARQTGQRLGAGTAAVVVFAGFVCHFWLCFQSTFDCWAVMMALGLLIAGFC